MTHPAEKGGDCHGRGLTDNHRRVLRALIQYTDGYLSFDTIAKLGEIDRRLVRRNVRFLARKGLAKYARGLWDGYNDTVGGAGYGITPAGIKALADLPASLAHGGSE